MVELSQLLNLSVSEKASDLHIAPGQPPIMRINGELVPATNLGVMDAETTQKIIYSSMLPEQSNEFEKNWEMDYVISSQTDTTRFRVNAFRQVNGVAAVFRVIPNDVPTLKQLGMPPIFNDILNYPNGLILVTGPTGSGKSTTLAAMIDQINEHQSEHIITIEDPIEFVHTSKKCLINQRQINRDTHDFNIALRSALRQDPDVILVGEMRDLETIRLALTAAETGHLVMATLHTSSAARTVNRIIDVFPASEKNVIRNLLSESLRAVVCQTLVRKIGGGRVAAFEIMLGTSAIRNLIREDKVAQMYSAIQTGASTGMITLDQYLKALVDQQVIDAATANEYASVKLMT